MPPYDVVTLLFQKDAASREFDAKSPTDEYEEGGAFLTPHPLLPLIAGRVDTPLDLHSLAVTRIRDVLEVPQEPAPVQCRIFACVANIHTLVHAAGG